MKSLDRRGKEDKIQLALISTLSDREQPTFLACQITSRQHQLSFCRYSESLQLYCNTIMPKNPIEKQRIVHLEDRKLHPPPRMSIQEG